MNDLEELKQRKLQALQNDLQQRAEEERLKEEQGLKLQRLLRKLLEPKARERMARVKLANPRLAEKVEYLILYLYQNGGIKDQLSDSQLKSILDRLSGAKRDTKITRI